MFSLNGTSSGLTWMDCTWCGGHGRTPDLPLSVTRPPWSVSAPQGGRPDAGAQEGTASGGQTVSRGVGRPSTPSRVEAQSPSRLCGSWVGRTPGRGTGQEPSPASPISVCVLSRVWPLPSCDGGSPHV